MTCKNCIHYEFIKTNASTYCLCSHAFNFKEELRHNQEAKCNYFKDKSHFVELHCKVGETVHYITFMTDEKSKAEVKLKGLNNEQ